MPRRVMRGTVVGDKADKTVVVRVDRRVMHPLYKKVVRRSKRYTAHDDGKRSQGRRHRANSRVRSHIQAQALDRARRYRRRAGLRAAVGSGRVGCHDSDADESGRRRQFRCAARAVREGAGRFQAQDRLGGRHHRRHGQGGDPARQGAQGRASTAPSSCAQPRKSVARTAAPSASTAMRPCSSPPRGSRSGPASSGR